jgi:hypothetical protein
MPSHLRASPGQAVDVLMTVALVVALGPMPSNGQRPTDPGAHAPDDPVRPRADPPDELAGAARAATMKAAAAGLLYLLSEIGMATGRVGELRAHDAGVRGFGSRLQAHHRSIEQRLWGWLDDNEDVRSLLRSVPAQGDPRHYRLSRWLARVPEQRFDRTFLKATIEFEGRALRFLEAARLGLEAGRLRLLVEQAIGDLERQSGAARDLLGYGEDRRPGQRLGPT